MAHDRLARACAFLQTPPPKGKAWASLYYAYEYETEKAMYLGWFDDNPKKTTATKIAEAIDAYHQRFHTAPNVVLVNEAERVEVAGVAVRSETYIRRNNFWVGFEYGYA